MVNKQHCTLEGVKNSLVNIKASLNTGLTTVLKENYSNILPKQRLSISNSWQQVANNIKPEWMVGFCT